MKINGKEATKNEELKVWKECLEDARGEHNIGYIKLASRMVKRLESEAREERINELLKETS